LRPRQAVLSDRIYLIEYVFGANPTLAI